MFYDSVRKKTVMFSGWQPGAGFYHPDQWEWDGIAQTWTKRALTGASRAPRFGASIVWDSARNRAVLFGGFDETTGAPQRHLGVGQHRPGPGRTHARGHEARRRVTARSWPTTPCAARWSSSAATPGAGAATAGTWVDETWEWDGTAGTWTQITAPAVTSTQYGSGYTNMVYDPVLNKIVLYYYWNYVWTYTAGATAGTGTWADAAPCRPRSIPRCLATTTPAWSTTPGGRRWWCSAARARVAPLWELNTTTFELDEPIRARQRPDPAPVPVDRLRQQGAAS